MPITIVDTVKVKYNFDGDNNTELTIRKDDIIDVLVIDPSGWADGIIRSKKKRGWFPMQYTRSILDHDSSGYKLPTEKNTKESNEDSGDSSFEEKLKELTTKQDSFSSNWKKKRTINGKKYYINIETNETTYNKNRTLRRNELAQISKELQNLLNNPENSPLKKPEGPPPSIEKSSNKELQNLFNNPESPKKPEGPPPSIGKASRIKNLANLISNSLSSSLNNLNNISPDPNFGHAYGHNRTSSSSTNSNNNNDMDAFKNDLNEKIRGRPSSANYPKNNNNNNNPPFGTPVNFYSNVYGGNLGGGDSDSSSLSNSCVSLNNIPNTNPMVAVSASSLGSITKSQDSISLNNSGEFSIKRPISPANILGSSTNLASPISPTAPTSSNILDKIKKLEIPKNSLPKKNNVEKIHQKLVQALTDFVNNLTKKKKSLYLDQCNEIKNTLNKLLISINIINQEGNIVATTQNQVNLYYSTMLALSKVILNVRDAVGQWPPPDVNQLIFIQMDDFLCYYQLLLNNINMVVNNENSGENGISPVINTNPVFLMASSFDNSNNILNKLNQQISIIMMSISNLIIVSRKEQSINQTIYKLSNECRDNISKLANDIDEIQFKNRKAVTVVGQFIHKKEALMNSIKELTITIKSSNEKFAPSNSLDLILESLSNCINIIDDISFIIRGLYDLTDSPNLSQQISFDYNESGEYQDSYEQNKKIFGEQTSVINGAFSKKLELMLKKKELGEAKSAYEPSSKHAVSMNEKINYKNQYNSEASLMNPQMGPLYKVKSNSRVATPGSKSKINKFFGDENAYIENEKITNATPKPWYLLNDYPKGSITYNMEGQINGATLTSYIEYVTSHENENPEFDQRILLLMFDQFCTVPEFIDHLAKRYFMKAPIELKKDQIQEWKEIKQTPIQNKVLDLINLWITEYWYEENANYLQSVINFLTDASNPINKSYSDSAIDILFKAKKRQSLSNDEVRPAVKGTPTENFPHPILPKSPTDKITFLDIDPVEFTRQMCLLVNEAYSKVHPHELMIVNKKNCKSDNIKMLTKISIRITQYIITMILSDNDPKKRNLYLRHAINICKKSFDERNFDLVFSVIAALNSSAIVRLAKTWALLPSKLKDTLELCQSQISHNKNYQKYRHILKTCEKPCIPFFGIILKDITFTEDGNSKYRKENLINISKFHSLTTIIEEYNSFKVPYNFKEVGFLQSWIKSNIIDVDEKDEQDLYDLSIKIEPREQNFCYNDNTI
ncbi:ras GEF [Anaeromyces robustus]|uniref:Ras GEF n=1 Tax=Anaeromyces robustus TaxID=1754192 RepID=A0A1Y1XBJ0_9FUNG|nr:ras GEF [Anaeromyces robustus]|eukprot:ORX83097.1 ras GEF [Anaeromyces robustus]